MAHCGAEMAHDVVTKCRDVVAHCGAEMAHGGDVVTKCRGVVTLCGYMWWLMAEMW